MVCSRMMRQEFLSQNWLRLPLRLLWKPVLYFDSLWCNYYKRGRLTGFARWQFRRITQKYWSNRRAAFVERKSSVQVFKRGMSSTTRQLYETTTIAAACPHKSFVWELSPLPKDWHPVRCSSKCCACLLRSWKPISCEAEQRGQRRYDFFKMSDNWYLYTALKMHAFSDCIGRWIGKVHDGYILHSSSLDVSSHEFQRTSPLLVIFDNDGEV